MITTTLLNLLDVSNSPSQYQLTFILNLKYISKKYTNSIKKYHWFSPGSNRGPFACEANVITTTLLNLLDQLIHRQPITGSGSRCWFTQQWHKSSPSAPSFTYLLNMENKAPIINFSIRF